jgi:prevent-host-death family protein
MYMPTTTRPARAIGVGEARRELPRLIRQIAAGGRAVAIGPRGRPAVILVGAEEYERLRRPRREPVSGWAQIRLDLVGSPQELEADLETLREERAGAIAARGAAPRPKRRR